ncbi:MAG: minor capsid protein [Desulfobulbus sp.]|nr:minor capsid protein [Desulfobulbus sp.]
MTIELTPLPMAEAQAFWADKVQLGPGEFAKLSAEAKVKAFAVSGIARGDELTTVFEAIRRAIDQGTTLADFKKECGAIFERRGWTGKRTWRVDNIFRTNIQTAYNVGKYKRLKDSGAFPYWQYSAINDRRTRPTHLAMDGRVWPADHPTWDTWFPPNGYRCRCSVIGLTARQAERMGVKIEEDDPTNGLIEPIDPITGNRMPARQLLPDPGFEINPGKVVYPTLGQVKEAEERMRAAATAARAAAALPQFSQVTDKGLRKIALQAFADAPENIMAVVRKFEGSVAVKKQRKKGSFYTAALKEITLGTLARSSPVGVLRTFRHEFGHHIDYASGPEQRSIRTDFAQALLDEDLAISRLPAQAASDLRALIAAGGPWEMKAALSDLIGAITYNKIQGRFGHHSMYYAQRGLKGRVTQAFANLVDIYTVGGEDLDFVQQMFPRLAAAFEQVVEELGAR